MHWMLCLLRLLILLSKHIHRFLPITFLIFNQFSIQKKFGKLRPRAFQPYHQYYICWYHQYKTSISNAFNAIYINTVDTKHIHTFLPITFLIFNRFSIPKSFGKLRPRAFQPYHQYYICWYFRYKSRISNAFNAIYVDTVDIKHIYTFLPITFLIFNRFSICKKFWKAEILSILRYINTIYVDTFDTSQGSLMHSMLSMSTLSIQNTSTHFCP